MGVALAVQAGPTLQFLECGNPTVGQLRPIVSVEACIFGRRAYTKRVFHDELHGAIGLL